jgi:hypothetical protein
MIEISFDKDKITRLIVISLFFLFAGICISYISFSVDFSIRNSSFLKSVGVLLIVLGLLASIINYKKSKLETAGLVINENGVLDNSNTLLVCTVLWKDIIDILQVTVRGNTFIVIYVDNKEKYIQGNLLNRILLSINSRFYKSPIVISTNTLKIDTEKLFTLLLEQSKIYKVPNS